MPAEKHFSSIGTNPTPYYIPAKEKIEVVQTNSGYFYIQVYGAQAAFTGQWWTGAQNLAITSQVNLNLGDEHDLGNQDLRSILQYREIDRNNAVQLGFSPMLVDFVPAKMKKVAISIEYLVNTKNYLKDVVGLITDKDLLSTISLAPGAAMVAKTLSGLAEKIVTSFIPAEERKPILQFSGEFDLAIEGLKEGYYVILGSHTSKNPLPIGDLNLEIADGGRLKSNGKFITQLSYVILKVGCIKAIRDRFTGKSPWADKLREVKRLAQDYADDPFAEPDANKKKEFWEKQCLILLREAQALIKADPNFLDDEVEMIYRAAYRDCLDLIAAKSVTRAAATSESFPIWQPNLQADRQFLGIPENENIEARLSEYAEKLFEAREVFDELGI
jgi:hypothetical protein